MSTLKVNAISNVAGTGSPNITEQAKAWVNFNGTGTVAIRGSFNVSSITDNGVGLYTVNFTTVMPDADYAVVGTAALSTETVEVNKIMVAANISRLVGSCRINTGYPASSVNGLIFDGDSIHVAIFR